MNRPAAHQPSKQPERIVCDQSSWLSYGLYDPVGKRLEIGFKDGRVKVYSPINPQTWLDFKVAPSKGQYYLGAIRKTTESEDIKK